jgi:hypothetical protein
VMRDKCPKIIGVVGKNNEIRGCLASPHEITSLLLLRASNPGVVAGVWVPMSSRRVVVFLKKIDLSSYICIIPGQVNNGGRQRRSELID